MPDAMPRQGCGKLHARQATTPTARRPRTPVYLAVIAVFALGSTACSSGNAQAEVATTPSTSETTTTTEATTTTASTAPTTTAATEEDVEAAVRAAHTRFMVDFFNRDERIDGPEATLDLAREITTGRVLARLEDGVAERVRSGERLVSPGYESNIHAIELQAASAKVLDCSLDTGVGYSSSGEALGQIDAEYFYRETWLFLEEGRWLVEEFLVGGEVSCDPNENPIS